MPNTLWVAPVANFYSTTLNGSINDSQTTGITLTSVTNLQSPGFLVLDRQDGSGNNTPNAREIISFTGISGNALTGVTRGANNSTARSHNDGALVESTMTSGNWNSLTTIVATAITSDGYLRAVASPVSIAAVHSHNLVVASLASVNIVQIRTQISASGASLTGFYGVHPTWRVSAALSGATTLLQPALTMPQAGVWEWFNFKTRTVASGVSAIVDINKNGVSIFDAIGRPMIAAGGTFVSTASIKTKGFVAGDELTIDYDGTGGHVLDIVIQGRGT